MAKLGIKVSLRQVNFAEHSSMMHGGKLGFWRGNWITDYPDPENVLALFILHWPLPKALMILEFILGLWIHYTNKLYGLDIQFQKICDV